MRRSIPIPDFAGPSPTTEELDQRKRVSDRAELLDHVDDIVRPPPWVYAEIEEAIAHAIEGRLTAEIQSRDGGTYVVADLIDRWDLGEMLPIYARRRDDPSYEPAGRWPPPPE
jgi:hypothetical protein